jgi:hypothetical protein
MTFEEWAEGRPVGPKDTTSYIMAKGAWDASREECKKDCIQAAEVAARLVADPVAAIRASV